MINSVSTQLILVLTSLLLIVPGVETLEAEHAITLLLGVVLSITGICKAKQTDVTLKDSLELDFTLTTLKTMVLLRPNPRFDLFCSQ
uniref:Uncharacterized protein n=1 Tax=Cricetulus griseus TaxID=10029 RepID=A0A8C2M4D8_CRIGR